MSFARAILNISDILKPFLKKAVPDKLLKIIKKQVLRHTMKEIGSFSKVSFQKEQFPRGINLIGNIKADSGLGQSCRLLADMLKHTEYPVCLVEYSSSKNLSMQDSTYDDELEKDIRYGINIFHINPHEFTDAYLKLPKSMWSRHYNIAYWLWELEDFPDEWLPFINLLDEIWTPAEFISRTIRKKTSKPVVTVPYHVSAPVDVRYGRRYFGLPEKKFLFLMMFDSGSIMERKNPLAVIEAFRTAFDDSLDSVGLVIKMNGGSDEDEKAIRERMKEYRNIFLINKRYSKIEVNSLIKCADVLVSLHRAEGFGLVLAEAMLNGVPCIATNWSANTEFMNSDVACMVDYRLVQLKVRIGPYEKGSWWAEPDISQAADYMIRLYRNSREYKRLSVDACEYVQERLSYGRTTEIIEERISEIYKEKEYEESFRG